MQTKYSHLTNRELLRNHRYDIQGDDLVEELWSRLEMQMIADEEHKVRTKYTDGTES